MPGVGRVFSQDNTTVTTNAEQLIAEFACAAQESMVCGSAIAHLGREAVREMFVQEYALSNAEQQPQGAPDEAPAGPRAEQRQALTVQQLRTLILKQPSRSNKEPDFTGCVFNGRFRVIKRLGDGSYGQGWEAIDMKYEDSEDRVLEEHLGELACSAKCKPTLINELNVCADELKKIEFSQHIRSRRRRGGVQIGKGSSHTDGTPAWIRLRDACQALLE